MEMRIDLRMKQTQQLVMTPKLQQALRLLQVPTLKLEQLIKQEIVMNPMLEETAEIQQEQEEESPEEESKEKEAEEEKIDWEDYFQDRFDMGYPPREEEDREYYEKVPAVQQTFYEHLLSQLHLSSLNSAEIEIGEYIIGNLDKNGYLTFSVEAISKALGIEQSGIEKVLEVFREHSLDVSPGAMSSIVTGEDDSLFEALKEAFQNASQEAEIVMIVTISNACPVAPSIS